MSLEEITGDFSSTRFSKASGDGSWIVGMLGDGTTVTGETSIKMIPGAAYRFVGKWQDSKYGRQFKFEHVAEAEPISRQAVVSFLVRYCGKDGVTDRRAHLLFEHHGADAIRILRENPEKTDPKIGLSDDQKIVIAGILAREKRNMQAKIDLALLFEGKGFSRKMIDLCVQKWGSRAAGIVKGDPFKLMTSKIKGAGFRRCDSLYLSLGHSPTKIKRQILCCWDHINRNDGDTWVKQSAASQAIRDAVGSVDVASIRAIRIGVRAGWLARFTEPNETKWISTASRAKNETSLACRIAEFWRHDPSWPDMSIDSGSLSPHQVEQLSIALQGRLGVLVGTPGTGKTYSVAQLVKAVQKCDMGPIAVCAPTGKAAVRASVMMKENGIHGKATSIHSLLKGSRDEGGWGFYFNKKNTLPYRVVIVDEFSMCDTDIAAALLDAIDPSYTSVLLVGDQHQLPPIGHGAPLRDLLALNRSVGRFEEIFRNSGLIVKGCRSIRDGQPIIMAETMSETDNLKLSHAYMPSATVAKLKGIFGQLREVGKRDLKNDIQVLVPLNTQGPLARETLSKILQNELNPVEQEPVGNLRKDDKIICLSNDYYGDSDDSEIEHYIANGEQGFVVSITKDGEVVANFPAFDSPSRIIRFREKSEVGRQFALAYAITVHKSQGSQWPVVIVIADSAAGRIATREWWYTAISRASERCIVIGDKNVVESQSKKISLAGRKTFLSEKTMEAEAFIQAWDVPPPFIDKADEPLAVNWGCKPPEIDATAEA